MNMNSPEELVIQAASNFITGLFNNVWSGIKDAPKWMVDQYKKNDPFGLEGKKYAEFILSKYNNMRIFGMSKPVSLSDIYINVKILEDISSNKRSPVDILKLLDKQDKNVKRDVNTISGIQLIKQTDFSMVLGKPGAGKTTFLKYLSLQCIKNKFHRPMIPIFISLRDWVDSTISIEDFIFLQFSDCGFKDSKLFVSGLLEAGKCLILLDGYDEVNEKSDQVVKDINKLVERYKKNKYIISCRLSANTHVFEHFTEVEVADFGNVQIEAFIIKWFENDLKVAKNCWKELNNIENKGIKELAKTPLLLTLICLAYRETLSFPSNRAELYEDALDALLKKWDSSRSIKRDNIYKKLTVRKKELLFSRIAAFYFKRKQIFFSEKELIKQIHSFMENLIPDKYKDNAEQVLKSIESQHGLFVERAHKVYSFSHLTFQEYFTARYISESTNTTEIEELIDKYLFNRRWAEIFILTSTLLPEADKFLIKIREHITRITLDRGALKLFLDLDSVVNKKYGYPVPILRAVALQYFLRSLIKNNHSAQLKTVISLTEDLIKELFQSYKIYINRDLVEIQVLDLGSAFARKTIDEIVLDLKYEWVMGFIDKLDAYLYSTQIFVRCMLADCYINKTLRENLLCYFLKEPWESKNAYDKELCKKLPSSL